MVLYFKYKVLFHYNSASENQEWVLYKKVSSVAEAQEEASHLESLGLRTLIQEQAEERLLSEVDYLLGAIDLLSKELQTTTNFIDLHMRLNTLTRLLVDAIKRERQGDISYIPLHNVG